MKLVTFLAQDGQARPGLLQKNRVFDLSTNPAFDSLLSLITAGAAALTGLAERVEGDGMPVDTVRLLAPLSKPPRIFAVGLNYADHAAESKMKVQTVPTIFMKLSSSVCGPDDDVVLPKNSNEPDYEAELAVVIGTPGYRIAADKWHDHVFGYTIVNDVSARDVQLATSQWTLGKSFPTFTPMGPCIVTADEIEDPHALDISLTIDGETLQNSNTRNLIFRIPQIIEHISSLTPLEAGDIISTGTPEGVGLGRDPKRWLKDGEEMVITIQNVGELRNRTRQEV
ncbi:MAG: fumarylacetoacetate hydrolase family protein [Janthinobacterium lividum]